MAETKKKKTAAKKPQTKKALATTVPAHVEKTLISELSILTKQVQRLRNSELLEVFKNPWKFMWFSLLKGLMLGLGTVLGASLLVGILVFILSKIQLVPVVGDFVQSVLKEIDVGNVVTREVPAPSDNIVIPASQALDNTTR